MSATLMGGGVKISLKFAKTEVENCIHVEGESKKLLTMGKGMSKIQKNVPTSFMDGPFVKTHLSLSSIM